MTVNCLCSYKSQTLHLYCRGLSQPWRKTEESQSSFQLACHSGLSNKPSLQSKLKVIPWEQRGVRESLHERVKIGFGFTSGDATASFILSQSLSVLIQNQSKRELFSTSHSSKNSCERIHNQSTILAKGFLLRSLGNVSWPANSKILRAKLHEGCVW